MSEHIPITIIGAGVIGCAIAHRLSKSYQEIFVFERNPKVTAENQSSRNSGVVHAGIYYPKDVGRLKAELCVKGNRMLYDFCEEFDVPHKKTGKLVLATEEWELDYLDDTLKIARENGVPDFKLISSEEAMWLEPNIRCIKAGYFPTSGIVEATQLVYRLFTLASQQEVFFVTNTKVVNVHPRNGIFEITTETNGRLETFESDFVINSAGLYSDEVARMVNSEIPFEILPIRGEAAKFYKTKHEGIGHNGLNIYPVPHPIDSDGRKLKVPFDKFKTLFQEKKVLKTVGVHLTPTFDLINEKHEIGPTVTIGPATKRVEDKEDNSKDLYPPQYYLNSVKPFFPYLKCEDISLHQAGVQAKLQQQYDWVIQPDEKHPNFIQLIGIDSPGLTSCLAIAEYVEDLLKAVK